MAELAAGFLGPALQVVKWVSAPILRQFNYLCCFTTNITSLQNEAEELHFTERDLQGKVDTARNDVGVICREVETWLEKYKILKDEVDGILNEVPNVESGCSKLRARFFLSKRAKKTTDRLKELRGQCKFDADAICQPRPPAATEKVPLERTYEFESRKKIEEDIMTSLRGEDVNMMGICGMGGLGKTTIAKRIMNRTLQKHVFEEAVMAVVSRPIDKSKIQLEIGGSLGLKLEGESLQARVQKLHARLSGTKRILLVLDDIWEKLVPEDLGIPCGYKGCTILLTSRNRDVLSAMNVQKIFGMEELSKEDSWFMFKERVGAWVDDTKLNSIAQEVVNECKGLPIALTTVGAALKDQMDVPIWEDALEQLRRCDPDIPEIIEYVYNPLRLSYDDLGSKLKSVFLLCCLFPEDAHISLELLTYFCMGLDIFERGIRNLLTTRNKIRALTEKLKSRSLLLDSEKGEDHVRMHDVVRDVCIFIAKQKGYISDNDCSWTSSVQRYKLPSGVGLLRISDSGDKEFKFDGIRDLYVLSIGKCWLRSLPFTQRQNNLITLVLDSCWRLETLSGVGELVNLEILICRGCDSIKEVTPEIKGLNRLKVLDLTRCGNLQRIGRGIVSSLVGLEELKMLRSFKKWEGEDREERENVGLRELEALTKLRCLEIEIQDPALAEENIRLSSKVDSFTISFLIDSYWLFKFDEYLSKKKMRLNLKGAASLGHWMQFLRDTECLLLVGNGAKSVDLIELEKIKLLGLGRCESMKNLVNTSMDDDGGATVFPSIEHLLLFKLPKLEEIWDHRVSLNCFQNLKELKLDELPALKQLWRSSQNKLGKDFLPQLEVLQILNCWMMEGVFLWTGEDRNENNSCHHITIMFPKLKKLQLSNLPNLISLCQGIEGIEFPLLSEMYIEECGKMKGMVSNRMGSSKENNSGGDADTHYNLLFCEIMSRNYDNWEKLVGAVLRREKDRQLAYCESFSTCNSADLSSRFSFDSAVEDADFSFNPFVGDVHLLIAGIDEQMDESQSSNWDVGFQPFNDMMPVSRSPREMFDPSDLSSQSIFFFRNVMAVEYEEIKKATKNFRPNFVLGEGGVYKGWLHEHYLTAVNPGSGIVVAVKKLNREGLQEHNQWVDEIHYLSQIHHPNIVKLIGYSFQADNRIVVYEFMPKGSLGNHLFTSRPHSLPWETRMKVAVGAARALAFLHGLEIPVIHRNIKSADILLDADFNPKLSDFGHAIDGPTGGMTHVETQVIGTNGYAAPEYLATGQLTTRCDVYGFGVVLVELITGLRAFDKKRPAVQQMLMYWVKPHLRDKKRLLRLMDSRLGGQYPRKEAYEVARIGLQCANLDPKLRPRMNEVVAALEKL